MASRAVAMAVTTQARAVEVEQEIASLAWRQLVVQSDTAGKQNSLKCLVAAWFA